MEAEVKQDTRLRAINRAPAIVADLGGVLTRHAILHLCLFDPVEIELAVAWLKNNEPDTEISLSDIARKVADAKIDAETIKQGTRTDLEHLSNRKKLQGGGTGADYTLRRLARDAPEMLDKIEAGELTVNAANRNKVRGPT